MAYDSGRIEKKWQQFWEKNKTFRSTFDPSRPKYYVLDMFPYPSGEGLHVGHPEGYTATDIVARYKRMRGFSVLHPMGYDAFGLPAEQYAVQKGVHPRDSTDRNISNIRRQIKSLGFSYDWDREISTTDVEYYKWTQWIFLKLFSSWFDEQQQKARPISELPIPDAVRGQGEKAVREYTNNHRLAFQSDSMVNWCPALGTVLANEEVTNEGRSERGDHPVFRRPLKQWHLRITKYNERLLAGLDGLDWPEGIKILQRTWIGRSEGAEVNFTLAGNAAASAKNAGFPTHLTVYTTRPDTLFGATYMVLAPEHPLVEAIVTPEQRDAVFSYRAAASRKTELERTGLAHEKTGVFTGVCAINPVNNTEIPVWVADYVMWGYGTGAIMAVPAHDHRDFAFARTFNLPIRPILSPIFEGADDGDLSGFSGNPKDRDAARDAVLRGEACWAGDGSLINSSCAATGLSIDGLNVADATAKTNRWLEEKGLGKPTVNYKLRDWLFSRQRYWGEPFPLLHGPGGEVVPVDESELPVMLPDMDNFQPRTFAENSEEPPEAPLARLKDWVEVRKDGVVYRRETNTMPQWAGSCWYYLRYLDPKNDQALADPSVEQYWMPVDLYIGGAEHATLHLLYARFWHMVLFDLGIVSTPEPFQKLYNQGLIVSFAYKDPRGAMVPNDEAVEREGKYFRRSDDAPLEQVIAKMSKSLKNVVNPDEVINEYGADSMRLYEMFMGPLDRVKPWQVQGIEGVYRFLHRIWRVFLDDEDKLHPGVTDNEPPAELERLYHKTLLKVTDDVENLRFNTAISQMMIYINEATKLEFRSRRHLEGIARILSPFCPHIAEELWEKLGHSETISYEPWPDGDPNVAKDDTIEVPVQVNGKVRTRLTVPAGLDEAGLKEMALADEKILEQTQGKTIRKVIVIPGRLVNIVVN